MKPFVQEMGIEPTRPNWSMDFKSIASAYSATPALCQRTFCFLWPDLDSNQDLPTCDWASLPLDDQTILLKMLIANHILSTTIHKHELIYL